MPNKNEYRIHHIRPRFKSEVESVLLFLANEIVNIGEVDRSKFRNQMNLAIKFYPGNATLKDKTINNWRTEIIALFGLIVDNGVTIRPSEITTQLSTSGNLIHFFRNFLYRFQYPGGHLKPREISNFIEVGVKFKPAHYFLSLLVFGTTQSKNRFGLSKEEATHLVLNDLNVTKDGKPVAAVFNQIMANRISGKEYDTNGDVVRYAGDILDYLVLADLVDRKVDGKYYPKMQNVGVIEEFTRDTSYFDEYDKLYQCHDIKLEEIKKTIVTWQKYAGTPHEFPFALGLSDMPRDEISDTFDGHDSSVSESEKLTIKITKELKDRLHALFQDSRTTLDIGNFGEAIAIIHEKNRITKCGGEDEIHKIQKIPEKYAAGYDIRSLVGDNEDFTYIHIEVKSTVSKNKLTSYSFNLTPNEYNAALTHGNRYLVYRIFITPTDLSLFIIINPIQKMKSDKLQMNASSMGNTFKFNEAAGEWKEILL